MRAQIELLSATPEELENLQVGLASQETFERYGLDRPYYLQDLRFEVVEAGSPQGNYIRVTSTKPITEPFLTFLVEAMWSRGRLLREYTVLLDPPTFAPPPVEESRPAVTAPQRRAPADSGRIERAPAPRSEPEPVPEPKPQAGEPDLPYDTTSGEDYVVQPRETLWGIASRIRPDFRLTMNQTMHPACRREAQTSQRRRHLSYRSRLRAERSEAPPCPVERRTCSHTARRGACGGDATEPAARAARRGTRRTGYRGGSTRRRRDGG
jgi:Tfp pilus assembly protein FimV